MGSPPSAVSGIPPDPSFAIVGLGNPGASYHDTRHNLGFRVVDELARQGEQTFRSGAGPYWICSFTEHTDRGILAKPTTYMNRSGIAARSLLCEFGDLGLTRFLVVADDLDLPLGRMRFRRSGGPGGHNGFRSLIAELGTTEFPRLRVGIGRPDGEAHEDVVDFVLEGFAADELALVDEMVTRGAEGVRAFLSHGIDGAMNRFNSRDFGSM